MSFHISFARRLLKEIHSKLIYDVVLASEIKQRTMPRSIRVQLLLICLSILVFQECRSLFIRNTQSGKCITTHEFDTTSSAARYFAILTNECLHANSSFRYLKETGRTELLSNIATGGTLLTFNNSPRYKMRVSMYAPKTPNAEFYAYNPKNSVKQTNGALSFYKADGESCAEPDASYYFLDSNQNLNECGKAEQQFTFGSVTSYKKQMENVGCSSIQNMLVKRADYGDFDKKNNLLDYNATIHTKCSILTNCQVKARCGAMTSCELTFNNDLLPAHYCPDTSEEIYTEYTCVDNYPSTLITGSNIRLSETYRGRIEIKSGSKWIRVNEKNWDKERERMLCQYLGFDETTNRISTTNHGNSNGQDVASGDLICYNTESSGVSCCVNLETSVIRQTIKIPYARCKLKTCDNPILQDIKFYSNSVFSGRGSSRSSDYKQARFYNNGWCPHQFGTKYLMIDLQRDYHIKQVIILGSRHQTSWSKSYSLKYSHTESLVNGRRATTINGNTNDYEASYTTLDIYNARYLKIQSTDEEYFCLRIELCGKAQDPAPVYDVTVTPRAFSAEVTWSLREKEFSSYITHYIIYLDGKELQTVSRSAYGTTIVVQSLKAFTDYTVGIQTQDSASQKSAIITKAFKTKEGAPSGPPLDVALKSRSKSTIALSWKPPEKSLWNARVLTGYEICYYIPSRAEKCENTPDLSFIIKGLQPSTKYVVRVAAGTSGGFGPQSTLAVITNGEPVIPVPKSYSILNISISKPANNVRSVMVVVQIATNNPKSSEDIKTNELKAHEPNTRDPYIAAHFITADLPSTFIVGDGKHYIYENKTYSNSRLEQNTAYIVFVRFFESQDLFYSTEWSNANGFTNWITPSGQPFTIASSRTTDAPPTNQQSCRKEKSAGASNSKSGTEWYIVFVSLLSGFIVGILFSYMVRRFRRRLRKRDPQPKPEPQKVNNSQIYEDLNLAKMNKEENYQSLTKNPTSSYVVETDPTYAELSQEREVENSYQSLT